MILSDSSGITVAGDLATRMLAFVRDSSVLVRLLTGQSIELIRLGTRMDWPALWLTHLFSSSTVSDLELQ